MFEERLKRLPPLAHRISAAALVEGLHPEGFGHLNDGFSGRVPTSVRPDKTRVAPTKFW